MVTDFLAFKEMFWTTEQKKSPGAGLKQWFCGDSLCKSSSVPASQNHLRHEIPSPSKETVPASTAQDTGRGSRRKHLRKTNSILNSSQKLRTDGTKKSDLPLLGPIFSWLVTLVPLPSTPLSGASGLVSSGASPHIPRFPWRRGLPEHTVGVSAPTIVFSLSQKAMHQSFCELTAFTCVKISVLQPPWGF